MSSLSLNLVDVTGTNLVDIASKIIQSSGKQLAKSFVKIRGKHARNLASYFLEQIILVGGSW